MKAIRFEERLTGSLRSLRGGGPERSVALRLEARGEHLPRIARDLELRLSGALSVAGLAEDLFVAGSLCAQTGLGRGLRYTLRGEPSGGPPLLLQLRRPWSPWRPLRSLGAVGGTLSQGGVETGSLALTVGPAGLLTFLASFRLEEAEGWIYRARSQPVRPSRPCAADSSADSARVGAVDLLKL